MNACTFGLVPSLPSLLSTLADPLRAYSEPMKRAASGPEAPPDVLMSLALSARRQCCAEVMGLRGARGGVQ